MKILIPYDGSQNAENALRDLSEAGLPPGRHEVLIVVTDVWLPETAEEFERARAARRLKVERSGMCSYIPARRKLEEERFLSCEARELLSSMFPSWDIRVETLPGRILVSSEVSERAETWGAQLIILGSRDNFAAQSAAEADRPPRIAGGRNAIRFEDKKIKRKSARPDFKISKAAAANG